MAQQQFCEVENTDPEQHQKWLQKHGFQPDTEGKFQVDSFEGKLSVEFDELYENIRKNVSDGYYEPLPDSPYDERTFVMCCGGPSLADHIEEIREKSNNPDKYLVVCSNKTGDYLLDNGITPHAHFILDPQEKKKYDIARTSPATQYWINVACNPAVFSALKEQGIKPYVFLAEFDCEGKATKAVKESLQPGKPGMIGIQGGTMAGLRAMNLADALGFRKMEYYGFDATVKITDGKAQPYAYEKKRGEAIIEVECDRCDAKFDSTLIFQKQVNEFLQWHYNMPWIEVKIIGGGLISHYYDHILEDERNKPYSVYRFSNEYAMLQHELHDEGNYGNTGVNFIPVIFHGVSQLAKRHGAVTILDYGSASGKTMNAVRENMWLPPTVTDFRYDPFVPEFSAEPSPADFVICTDVLEHVEPNCTKAVLDHIQSLTKRMVFFSISMVPARKVLSDGRNAHINLRDTEFWLKEIKKRFITSEVKVSNGGESLLVIAQSITDVAEIMRARKNQIKEAA